MSAVGRVARAGVRRRRLQTIVIGVVVLISSATIVLALGLLAASSGPFDQAFARQDGAHLVATFGSAAAPGEQVARTAQAAGVTAAAGPFGQTVLSLPEPSRGDSTATVVLTTVGRADPGGPVDKLNLWAGRWPSAPGEIVLNGTQADGTPASVGDRLTGADGVTFTVVGLAYSVSQSADAWVTPAQMAELHPTAEQMLYRFGKASSDADVAAGQAAVTAGLPAGALTGARSYLVVKSQAAAGPGTFAPFLIAFGVMGLVVGVMIVANVVSGAVVAGSRNIGILKSLGFTPNQVMSVYLVMVSVPAVVATVAGTALGTALAEPVLSSAFEAYGAGAVGVAGWAVAATLVGMPLVVLLAALIPSLRVRRLSAIEAMGAGSARQTGRALRAQRWLAGSGLPRSVSLGVGLPFARPGRTLLTVAAVVMGVVSVTFATGLTKGVTAYEHATSPSGAGLLQVPIAGRGYHGVKTGVNGTVAPTLSDAQDEAMLRALPGTLHLATVYRQEIHWVGNSQETFQGVYLEGDPGDYRPQVVKGHWPDGPGEIAVSGKFLNKRGLHVGDDVVVNLDGAQAQLKIVADISTNDGDGFYSDRQTQQALAPALKPQAYLVQLKSGTRPRAYMAAVTDADPGLRPGPIIPTEPGSATVAIAVSLLLTLLLGTVSALGVFNTVVLNSRERRRDLGVLKAMGMSPGQATLMMVTSMGMLGAIGGLIGVPLGYAVDQIVGPAMLSAAQADVTGVVMNVYSAGTFLVLGAAGVVIAVLGAFFPARSAARSTIAHVLQAE